MSERKVLNKYYPPDFDPSKIPRLRLSKDRQYTVRLMAPCNMRCKTCGEYIYKGKKFNARKETVQNEEYLGIKIFRFYIKCPRCLAEITFKTDPENTDYVVEHGASRNFQALKLAEEQAEKEAKELEEEEKNNPMKLLENRTQASKQEMELLESLEELKDLNQRHAKVDFEQLLNQNYLRLEEQRKKQENEDEALIRSVFGKSNGESVKRIVDEKSDSESEDTGEVKEMLNNSETATDILCAKNSSTMKTEAKRHKKSEMSIGVLSLKSLTGIVKINKKPQPGLILNSDESSKVSGQQKDSLTVKQPEDIKVQKQESLSISHSAALNLLTAYSNSDLSSESD